MEEVAQTIEEAKKELALHREQATAAQKALEGLPYVAVPLDQLASIYERFLRLTRLGSLPLDQWEGMPEAEVQVRRAIFRQSDFGAVFSGQWLPRELRAATRAKSKEPEPVDEDDFS